MQAFQPDEVILPCRQLHLRGNRRFDAVDVADEVADKLGLGVVVDLVRRANLLDIALVEHGDAIGQGQCLFLVMGDVDGCDAELALHLLQLIAQLNAQFRVQIGQRLVHADDAWSGDEGAGDGDALLLTAGQLADCLFELLVGQIDLARNFPHLLVDFRLFQLFELQAERDVVVHRHRREQRVALEYDADVALLNRHMGNILLVHRHRAGDRLNKAGDGAQGGRFAAAGRAEEGKELPFLHVHVDIVQRLKIAEFDHNVLEFNHGRQLLTL